MADELRITKEIMEKATTYIPIAMKAYIANDLARACVRDTQRIGPDDGEEEQPIDYNIPPSYCENPSVKARIMMTILMTAYLHVFDESTPFLCESELYDQWAGAHVLNQLERFKSGEFREKAFDLLSDYREMEKYLNSAVYGVLRELNDPVKRFMTAIANMSSSETLQASYEKIQEMQNALENEKARQDAIIQGTDEGAGEESAG